MSIENEDSTATEQSEGRVPESSKQSKILYSRKFLLSLSNLEVCQKLPTGFDESLLSEFRDASHSIPDRPRVGGSSILPGFRRNDYSSSPPRRGDVGNYSKGLHRWDSRSSGRSDTDSQSDKDSDSGRRIGSQYRRSWQNPEHDGLLGSGSFPRPPGYGAGASGPRLRSNDQHQLTKSNDPYHPPRPYKAVPHTKKEDSYNDETFGSSEVRSDDRAEEERKRRAEFEMMRKEQHKALQEKLKLNVDKLKEDPLSEIIAMDNSEDVKAIEGHVTKPAVQSDVGKIPSSQATTLRPLVPPGFRNTAGEKSPIGKSLSHSDTVEVAKLELEAGNQDQKEATLPLASKGGMKIDLLSASEMPVQMNGVDTQSLKASNFSNIEVHERDSPLATGSEHTVKGEGGHPASILEKIFSGALALNGGDDAQDIQDDETKADDVWSPGGLRLSKFAQWFPDEAKKEDVLPGRSSYLLSLIVGEKSGSILPEVKVDEHNQPFESDLGKVASNLMPKVAGSSILSFDNNKAEENPPILTCEDLEQSILSEVGQTTSASQLDREGINSVEKEKPCAEVDSSASNHLLSLLLKGSSSESPFSLMSKSSSNKPHDSEAAQIDGSPVDSSSENAENLSSSERKLTLEALFGPAFMNELHSVDQIQRNSTGSTRIDAAEPVELPFSMSDDGIFTSSTNEVRLAMMNDNVLPFEGGNVDRAEKNWMGFGCPDHRELDSVKMSNEIDSKLGGLDGLVDVQLPEEDSLISASDPLNGRSSMHNARSSVILPEFAGNAEMSSSSNRGMNIVEKLAALSASAKDDQPMGRRQESGPPFHHIPYDMMKQEVPFSNTQTLSVPQFDPSSDMNHGRPMFHPLDSLPLHMDPQLNFSGPEGAVRRRDGPRISHFQFPGNISHPPFPRSPDFDHPGHSLLHQQMHVRGNLPPPHMLQAFPSGGSSLPPHHTGGNHAVAFVQERGFPLGERMPNLLGLGMPRSGPDGGMNNQPPETFQRLVEREVWLKQNQLRPPFHSGGGSHNPMYGNELDAGFWYR